MHFLWANLHRWNYFHLTELRSQLIIIRLAYAVRANQHRWQNIYQIELCCQLTIIWLAYAVSFSPLTKETDQVKENKSDTQNKYKSTYIVVAPTHANPQEFRVVPR